MRSPCASVSVVEHPLTALFIDCDSYFASVEQHLDPYLRGKPVGVAPVIAETSSCIAASYEAKAFGVKTGTGISEARQLCPSIRIVLSKPEQYILHHHRIIEAVESCTHVEAVLSIDEMWSWLPLNLREPETVRSIGESIKAAVARDVSPVIKVSIGAAPNKWLAKTASKMRKPDGLFIIQHSDLPDVLYELPLRDLHGIAGKMEARLRAANIHSTKQLCAAPKKVLRGVWGGVLGDRLWHLLRGDEIPDLVSARKTIGHSHVLAPDFRKPDAAWDVLCKLTHKACERLRSHGMLAGSLTVKLSYLGGPAWAAETTFNETDATVLIYHRLRRLWSARPDQRAKLLQVALVLSRLVESTNHTPSLFDDSLEEGVNDDKHRRLDATLDKLRARYGRSCIYFGTCQDSREAAPMRISFTHIPNLDLERD